MAGAETQSIAFGERFHLFDGTFDQYADVIATKPQVAKMQSALFTQKWTETFAKGDRFGPKPLFTAHPSLTDTSVPRSRYASNAGSWASD